MPNKTQRSMSTEELRTLTNEIHDLVEDYLSEKKLNLHDASLIVTNMAGIFNANSLRKIKDQITENGKNTYVEMVVHTFSRSLKTNTDNLFNGDQGHG